MMPPSAATSATLHRQCYAAIIGNVIGSVVANNRCLSPEEWTIMLNASYEVATQAATAYAQNQGVKN